MSAIRVLFVCGSLEPGRDGVGDYTRELAGALLELNVESEIIAIVDRGVSGIVKQNQSTRGREVSVTRLSKLLSFSNRKKEYQNLIASFNPDYISLQFVPYAFSPKGIPFRLVRFLKTEEENIKWHFMIHEAYVWDDIDFKHRIIKTLEIIILKYLVKNLRPKRIHTSNSFYQKLLTDISINSELLGLFGNIKILDFYENVSKPKVIQGVFFGSGPMPRTFSIFSDGIKQFSSSTNTSINIVFCGKPDFRTLDFISYLENAFTNSNITITKKGILESDDVSLLLLQSHFGISREPPALMGKSGTVMVMLEHGLPVWVPLGEDENDLKGKFDFRVDQCSVDLNEILLLDLGKVFKAESRLESITKKFYNSLSD